MSSELTTTDRERLATLEAVVEQGKKWFVEVGHALTQIREQRLYREDYPTFEDYCNERWGFSRQRASQLIQGAKIVEEVSTTVDIGRASEGAVRELGRSPREYREMVAARAAETGEVTSASIRQARAEIEPKQDTDEPEHEDEAPDRMEVVRSMFDDAQRSHRQLAGFVREILDHADSSRWMNEQEVLGALRVVREALKFGAPAGECPVCNGAGERDCKGCDGLGWVIVSVLKSLGGDKA